MDAKLFGELVKLNKELNKLDRGRVGRARVILYCECGRSLRIIDGGLTCPRHGLQAKVVWRKNLKPLTAPEIREVVDEERAA